MTEVISIKFRGRGKSYYFDPAGVSAVPGDKLVVETSKGMELGDCCEGNHTVEDSRVVQPLRPVIRKATEDDLRVAAINREREKEAMVICAEKIVKHGLEMKLVDVECSFEGNKILFFFTADGRVDFRELVKDLAGVFRTRIELRQIGVRDEAKMLGGLGICGRPFCCSQFLEDFQPVSTKMAKTQSMSLNPAKISGTCGRLMCCLRYEQEAYEDLVRHVPKNGAFVETTEGYGNVVQVNLLRQQVKVRLDGAADGAISVFPADEIAEVPGALASPEYAASADLEWTDGQTLTAAIGQSYNLFTPLQLANYTATLVGDGEHYQAHLLKNVKSYDNSSLIYAYDGQPLNTVEMSESTQKAVLQGMRNLVTGSLYYQFRNCVVPAGAKTGTAEIGGGDVNGVFIAFAPYDDPQIAVAVAIEKASAGAELAPIAVDILNAYFSRDEIGTVILGENTLIQ